MQRATRSAEPIDREGSSRLRIVVLPGKSFPCTHAMLDGVFAHRLAQTNDVRWVMAGAGGVSPGSYVWGESVADVVRGSSGGAVAGLAGTIRLVVAASRAIGRDADVVVVRNSVRLAVPALLMRAFTGTPVVYQFSFPVAERTLAHPGAGWTGRVRAVGARGSLTLRRIVLRRSDLVMAISDAMAEGLVARGDVRSDRVVVVPLGAEPDPAAVPGSVERERERLRLGDAPLVLYFGAIAPERRLTFLVDVATATARRHPDALWVLVGPSAGGAAEVLRRSAASAGLADRFVVLDPVPRSELGAYVAAAAVTVSPIPPDPLFETCSPTKTVESLAWATPVVATPVGDQGDLVRESGGGVVAPFEVEAFADGVAGLLSDPAAASEMGARGRAHVLATRSYDLIAEQLERRLRMLAARRTGAKR
jgi:glycosyltransferase involved in cell wall biosynthesis